MGVSGAALATTVSYVIAIALAVAIFVRDSGASPWDVFRFGRDDVADYRALATRLRSAVGR